MCYQFVEVMRCGLTILFQSHSQLVGDLQVNACINNDIYLEPDSENVQV